MESPRHRTAVVVALMVAGLIATAASTLVAGRGGLAELAAAWVGALAASWIPAMVLGYLLAWLGQGRWNRRLVCAALFALLAGLALLGRLASPPR